MVPSARPTLAPSVPRTISTHEDIRTRTALPYRLSGGLAVLLAIASAAGLFVPGLYRDAPDWVAQTRGTDLVTLTLAVPALLASLSLAARGSRRAEIVWLGAIGYILYMYAIYAFDVAFNPLFLVYVASFSLALWSTVALLARADPDGLRARCAPGLPVRWIAAYLLGVAALFCLAWLKEIVPATLGNTTPTGLRGLALPTNPVHVLDLSVLLPLAALSGIWLWQRRPWGYLLAGVLLTTMTLIGLSIVSIALFDYRADPTASLAAVPMFALVTLAGLGLLVCYLRHLGGGVRSGPR